MADPCPQAQPACGLHLWPSSCIRAAKPKSWSGCVVLLVALLCHVGEPILPASSLASLELGHCTQILI